MSVTLDVASAYNDSDFVMISKPTHYDLVNNYFDISSLESLAEEVIEMSPDEVTIIKSTYWVEFTKNCV